jgi:hypothetical protein
VDNLWITWGKQTAMEVNSCVKPGLVSLDVQKSLVENRVAVKLKGNSAFSGSFDSCQQVERGIEWQCNLQAAGHLRISRALD